MGEVGERQRTAREQRLPLRVFAGRASAAASTSDLSRESLERVGRRGRPRWPGSPPRIRTRGCRIRRRADRAGARSRPRGRDGDDLSPEAKIEMAAPGRGRRARVRPAHHELGGRRVRRSTRALRLRHVPRLRPRLRDVELRHQRGARWRRPQRRDAARLLVLDVAASAPASRIRPRSGAPRPRARAAASGRPQDEDRRGPGRSSTPRPRRASCSSIAGRGERAEPLPARVVPARPARHRRSRSPAVTIVDDRR